MDQETWKKSIFQQLICLSPVFWEEGTVPDKIRLGILTKKEELLFIAWLYQGHMYQNQSFQMFYTTNTILCELLMRKRNLCGLI